jgi:hypothetical protein
LAGWQAVALWRPSGSVSGGLAVLWGGGLVGLRGIGLAGR